MPPQGYMTHRWNHGSAMLELLQFISYLITLYTYVVIAVVIFSWLMAFGVINAYNPTVRMIYQALNALTEPLLKPIRNVMPEMGGLDISPVILLLACYFIQTVVLPNIAKAVV
jgi:YggT family protein